MQDLLSKIIETDENARKIKEAAERDKLSSEAQIEELRLKIYDDYITRAKSRVEKTIAMDRQQAEERYAELKAESAALMERLQSASAHNTERWADEIAQRAINSI